MNEQTIFTDAIERDPVERLAFLDGACGADKELRERVEKLIRLHENAGDFLEQRPGMAARTEEQFRPEKLGTQIGPYKLLQQIGEGGMGVVYMAEQTHPVQRKVAMKVIKPGMDSRQVVARFEAERQALAMMDHVNIARVLDAGATDSGRPYFVMELVHGVPITKYCDDNHLSPRERLELFVPVCHAIQHAHQKGIIHRDIKPSNVMITLYDGKPAPKVIDFGVAKATEQKLTERTLFTQYGTMVGTPQYMSPEQAEMSALGVDTRSDIYSLGVLLYELLTGSTPLSPQRLREAAYGEVLRLIREEEPPKPSTRLSQLGETLAPISAQRQTEPAKLTKLIRGELDWIVMKTLEKDRNRRYGTASDFAADVLRYLNDESVQACPPTAAYRIRKLARRHHGALATASVVLVALLTGISVATWQAVRATRAEGQAKVNEARALGEQQKARAHLKKAREAVDQMLLRVAGKLANVPHMEQVRRELLGDSLKFYEEFLQQRGSDPEVRFETGLAYIQFGEMQKWLGEDRPAEQAYVQAIGIFQGLADQYPGNAEYRHNLAHSHNKLGNLFRENGGRIADSEREYRTALAITRKLEIDFPGKYRGWVAGRLNNIGLVLSARGRLAEAESVHREALAIRLEPGQGALVESYTNLRSVLYMAGRLEEAEQLSHQALAIREKAVAKFPKSQIGRFHLAISHGDLGLVLAKRDRYAEGENAYRKSLALFEKLTTDFPNVPDYRECVARSHSNLGNLLKTTGRVTEAEAAYVQSLTKSEKLAADFPIIPDCQELLGDVHHNLAVLFWETDRLPEAEFAIRRSVEIYKKLVTEFPNTPEYTYRLGHSTGHLGLVLLDTERVGEAEELVRQSLTIAEKVALDFPDVKEHSEGLGETLGHMGMVQYRLSDWKAAAASLQKALEQNSEHENVGDVQFFLAMTHWQLGNKDQARMSYCQAVQSMDKKSNQHQRLRRFRAEAEMLLVIKEVEARLLIFNP